MRIQFRRSLTLFPGLRLNFSRSGIGWSAGRKGLHAGVTAKGKPYVSAGIPGTGIYARQDFPVRRSWWSRLFGGSRP